MLFRFVTCLYLIVGALCCVVASAQTTLPHIDKVQQTGGQRGTSWDLTVAGPHIGRGSAILVEGDGVAVESIKATDSVKGANAVGTVLAHLKVSPGAEPGRRAFRVVTPDGVSDVGYFVIGAWPEKARASNNTTRANAQSLETPVTVIGTLAAAETHWYRFHATQGESVVCEPLAGKIGSSLEPVLTLQDIGGHEVAATDDFSSSDPALTFVAPSDADYLLAIRDIDYRGGDTYSYRLTVGAIPYVESALPSGGRAGSLVELSLTGANLGIGKATLTVPDRPVGETIPRCITLSTGISNACPTMVEDPDASVVVVDSGSGPHPISVPTVVYGQIAGSRGDPARQDFVFAAREGQKLRFVVTTHPLGSRLVPVMTLFDSSGKAMSSVSANGAADPTLNVTAPKAAVYRLRVSDLSGLAGPRYTFRLEVNEPHPNFRISYTPDRPAVGAGGATPVLASVERVDGFDGDVALTVDGLPAGAHPVGPMRIARGRNETTFVLTASRDALASASEMRLGGTATIEGRPAHREARGLLEIYSRNGDNQIVRSTAPVALPLACVSTTPDIVITTASNQIAIAPGKSVEIVVHVARNNGFAGKIPLTLRNLPAGVTAADAEIPDKQTEGKIVVKGDATAAVGDAQIVVVGSVFFDELNRREFAAAPVGLSVRK